MEEVLIFATILAPILTALVQLVKKTVKLPTNIVPALSFVIGILLGAIAYPFTDLDLVLRLCKPAALRVWLRRVFSKSEQNERELRNKITELFADACV